MSPPEDSSQDPHAERLKQAQTHLYERRFDRALTAVGAVLEADPAHQEALYLGAVCARYAARPADAKGFLDRLKAAAPEFGRAWQEEGHLLRSTGSAAAAIRAYQLATRFNPALIASWKAQAELLDAAGRQDEAAQSRAQVERLEALPKELVAVTYLIHEGKTLKAETLCRHFLQKHPHHVEAMRLLADIGVRMGVLEDAEFLLESAVEFEPDNIQLRLDYIQVLRKRQKFADALEQARALYDRDPENSLFASHYAIESMQAGDYETALARFDAILAKLPEDPATLTSRGHALKTCGRHEEAVASYRRAIAARSDHGDAWYGLANLKTYRFEDAELGAMQEQEARSELVFQDRVHLCFALGKALEDRDAYEASFGYYEKGNALKRAQSRYDADQMSEELHRQIDGCTPELFTKHEGAGCDTPDPIFILGLPRAGSTLLEQILASHSQIDGTLELPNILSLAHKLRGRKVGAAPRYPQILHELDDSRLAEMGRDYIENTRIHRRGAPYFIDKMPNNFRHIGLIQLILPKATIIDARREPMACCFSNFKQLFAEGQEFTYGLTEIGRYYHDYVELMDHWDNVLPGRVLRVRHEDVLEDLEGQVRRMLDHIGLPFEEACLAFHKTERAVRTASSEQVRRPIDRGGTEAWKHYEPWLGDLRKALD